VFEIKTTIALYSFVCILILFWFTLEWRVEVSGLWFGESIWYSSKILLCRGEL